MSTVHTSWCTFAPIYQIVSEQFKMCCCFCLGKEIAPLPQTVLLNAEFLGLSEYQSYRGERASILILLPSITFFLGRVQ
ncbi:hypothetical protein JHK82_046961 [Glycine max]|uniref:Uncharacterized protein n=1 Tax=Glycine max TaxID=3847 RepID=K7MKM7_SOYBN|nr:hypothetical protein JHK86_046853 [Glycine max]KAG4942772.1 hypothetical protein JHK85_047418 [Glycine max]KAG5097107.1 hypothetical protein JHK82_046961 [Glycine max]KAG5101894.1 hypothetical protein JHK84_046863 [Glycine max]KAH1117488.1 hypothetical protein GYH30_046674 [Glycine max]